MKHNKAVHCNQFRKDVHAHIKTWFNQPARAHRRRVARQAKLAKAGTRPINSLRPVVQCGGQKYSHRQRAGKGFTPAELKAVGLCANSARSIGIAVDPRRVHSKEHITEKNVERLREYLSKMVVFTKNADKVSKSYHGIPAPTLRSSVEGKTLVHKINNKPQKDLAVVSF